MPPKRQDATAAAPPALSGASSPNDRGAPRSSSSKPESFSAADVRGGAAGAGPAGAAASAAAGRHSGAPNSVSQVPPPPPSAFRGPITGSSRSVVGDNETRLALIPISLTIIAAVVIFALCYPGPDQWSMRVNHAGAHTAWTWRVPGLNTNDAFAAGGANGVANAASAVTSTLTTFFSRSGLGYGAVEQHTSNFLGREEELQRLLNVVRGSTGTAFAHVFGAQGVGKTTFVREFVRRVNTDPSYYMNAPISFYSSAAGAGASASSPAQMPASVVVWLKASSLQVLAGEVKNLADYLGLRYNDLHLESIVERVQAFLYRQPTWIVVFDDVIDERVLQVIPTLVPRLQSSSDAKPPAGPVLTSREQRTNAGAVIVISPSVNALNPAPGSTFIHIKAPALEIAADQLLNTVDHRTLLRGVTIDAQADPASAAVQSSSTPIVGAAVAAPKVREQALLIAKKLGRNPSAINYATSYLTQTTVTVAEYLSDVKRIRDQHKKIANIEASHAAFAFPRGLAAATRVNMLHAERMSPLSTPVLALMAASSSIVTDHSFDMWSTALSNPTVFTALSNSSFAEAGANADVSPDRLRHIVMRLRSLALLRGPFEITDASNVRRSIYHTPITVQFSIAAAYAPIPANTGSANTDASQTLSRLDIAAQSIVAMMAARTRSNQNRIFELVAPSVSAWETADHESTWIAIMYENAAHTRAAADVLAPSPLIPATSSGALITEAKSSSLAEGALSGLQDLASFTSMVMRRSESSVRFSDLARARGHPLPLQVVQAATNTTPEVVFPVDGTFSTSYSGNTDAAPSALQMSPLKSRYSAAILMRISYRLSIVSIAHLRAGRTKTARTISAAALIIARYALVAPEQAPEPRPETPIKKVLNAIDTLTYFPDADVPLPLSSAAPPEVPVSGATAAAAGSAAGAASGSSVVATQPAVPPFKGAITAAHTLYTDAARRRNLAGVLLVRSLVFCDCGTRLRSPSVAPDIVTAPASPIEASTGYFSARAVVRAIGEPRKKVYSGMPPPSKGECADWNAAKSYVDEALDLVWNQNQTPASAAAADDGVPSPMAAIALSRLAHLYERNNQWEEALSAHQYALQAEMRFYGERSVPVYRRFAHIAQLWFDHSPNRNREALSAVYKAFSLAKQLFDDFDPRLADAISALGKAYARSGRGAKAVKQLEEALTIEIEAGGEFNPRVLARSIDLANLQYAQKDLEKALNNYHRVARALEVMIGPHSPMTAQWNARCVSLYQQIREEMRARAEAERRRQAQEQKQKSAK